jgi:cyclophilin family peptidyl-prolyl cis-trans isomerase
MKEQTIWIVGGGVLVLAVAALLYVMSGKGIDPATMPEAQSLLGGSGDQSDVAGITVETSGSPVDVSGLPTTAVIKTSMGDITVRLAAQDAPKTVDNFATLARQGFFDGTKFHRVIGDFMIQGGDPLSKDDSKSAQWGTGGPGYTFPDEINDRKLVRGSLAMANSGPNTNGSQFFIVTKDSTPWLDGKHTNFGEVIGGMDVAMQISAVETGPNDAPLRPVSVTGIEIR